jgi:hypothetical protein
MFNPEVLCQVDDFLCQHMRSSLVTACEFIDCPPSLG